MTLRMARDNFDPFVALSEKMYRGIKMITEFRDNRAR